MSLVVGADGCPSGWILAARDGDQNAELQLVPSFAEALSLFPSAAVFAVDIPIGLPTSEPRPADAEARAFLGPRRSSVFPAPPTATLDARDYAEALALARSATGKGISGQAWALMPKIRELAELSSDPRVFEVHPEVSFRKLAGRPLRTSKKTWSGLEERRLLLASVGIEVPAEAGEAGDRAAPDDVLDALVACWSASRIARDEACHLPRDSSARAPAIWY